MGDDPLSMLVTESFLHRRVFWHPVGPKPESKSSSSGNVFDPWAIHEKLRCAFSYVQSFPLKDVILQYWAPVRTESTGRVRLFTYGQPFAIVHLNRSHRKYRLCSMNYQYSIDDANEHEDERYSFTINGGLPAKAYRNHFPEVVIDMRVHQGQGNPLLDYALECGFTSCIMLPVFMPNYCAGIVECCMKSSGVLVIFNELKRALEAVGMGIYHVKGCWPYKTISSGLEPATNEIEKALEIVCESHALTLGQVWITYESKNRDRSSASSSSSSVKKGMFLVRLRGYCVDSVDDPLSSVKDFYDKCDVLPFEMGEGLVGKTLQSYQPHFCRSIYMLSDNGLLSVLYANTKCSCLVICLRSIHTRDIDYVFEFFWPQSRNYVSVLECLFLTLSKCLPSFKFSSGDQLANDLRIIDVENFIKGITSFDILKGGKFSRAPPKALTSINTKSYPAADVEDDDLVIVALYKDDATLFLLPNSSKLEIAKEKINQDFELDPTVTYKLEWEAYLGKWFSLDNDQCFEACDFFRRSINKNYVKVRVNEVQK